MTAETQCCTAGTVTAGKVHAADCKPDALTRLEQWAKSHGEGGAAAIISEARKEMDEFRTKLAHAGATAATLSAKMGDSVRQGQQQGRVELAQEILPMLETDRVRDTEDILRRIVGEDAGQ